MSFVEDGRRGYGPMDTGVVVTVVGMVLTSLGALGAAVVTYLTNRDKLRFDIEKIKLVNDLSVATSQLNTANDKIASIEKHNSVCIQERDEARLSAVALAERLRIVEAERAKAEFRGLDLAARVEHLEGRKEPVTP